ncbi:DUF58 domain-containing protein [Kitasatospora sp. NBC_01287]|uniref:DUF58 domain-containing protein n=1 Tax=Kitasatospora sp. NBC_01287 TaxID=2903573 RepID=UPI0022599E2C|nr:DUF58 domain-containing protein [Kitasatospora sp. NBC_01287]MCX4745515.1 DUF58 domain-containing protein [Kitasatospora sp. NBC_01287]
MSGPVSAPALGAPALGTPALDQERSAPRLGLSTQPPPPPGWRASERTLRLLTVAVAASVTALLTGQAWLFALAAGPAVLLALVAPGRTRPTRISTEASVTARRCFEQERISVRIEVRHDGATGLLDPVAALGPGLVLSSERISLDTVTLELTATRWGRWSIGHVDLDVYDTGHLTRRTVRVELGEIEVFPVPGGARLTPIPVRLPERLGEHTTRQHGEGVEVNGVRPHVWGERQRRIHWPSTTRRGSIQVNQFSAERAVDTVLLLDALADFRDPATGVSTLDESLRAAAGLTRAYLRTHDRIGVVSIGGTTRWLRAGSGEQHFYRIVQSVLDVRKDLGYRTPDLHRLPPAALPPGALVYAFTPLADQRTLDVLGDLADRGNPLVVVEIPTGDPLVEDDDEHGRFALRLWRADREAMRFALRNRGIPVVAHTAGEALDLALAPLLRGRIRGRQQ